MANFVHLHVHTDHSFLDGCSRIKNLMARVSELEMPAIAITDHGNMCGALDFYNEANSKGIKPIIGLEAYLVHDHNMLQKPKKDRNRVDDISDVESDQSMLNPQNFPKNQIHHKTLLAKNYEGFLNLSKLSSLSYTKGFYYRPRIDVETIAKHSKGIIALSGCLNGVASQYLLYSDYEKARKATGEFVDIFGKENYFIEIQNHCLPMQQKIIPGLIKLAKEFDLKLVATNDTHYVRQADSIAHDAMLCIQTQSLVSDEKRMRYPNNEFYIKNRQEMEIVFPDLPEALDNTLEVAEMVDIKLPKNANHYPKYQKAPDIVFDLDKHNFNRILDLYVIKKNEVLVQQTGEGNFSLSDEDRASLMDNGLFLFDLCKKGLIERYGVDYDNPELFEDKQKAKELCDKLEYELSIIIGAGFVDYFLIVYDFISWARSQKIPVGPGRGSGAGCMIAYILKITDIEPIRFGLLFERMLSLERVSPPDFDVDFCKRRRDEVIEYVRQKYGEDKVANIITFNTLGAKAVVRDIARVNEIPYEQANNIAKKIPKDPKMTLAKALVESPDLKQTIDTDESVAYVFKQCEVLEGMVRNAGKHACGIIIGDQPLDNLVPMMLQDGDLTTQLAKEPVENLGLLKADFLGLKTLTVIADAQENINITRPELNFNIEDVSLEDKHTFRLLNRGMTTGVFQLESGGMQNLCRRIGLSVFEEIIALVALFRPGPMQFIDQFIESKKDPSKIQVPHPLLKDLVQETYGVLVYQEQVMESARIIAGYTLGEADILRRAMGKKKPEVMKKQESIFVEKAQKLNGLTQAKAKEIFEVLNKFASYGFNKSHSAAYAILSYRTAYLKANYPVEFMAASLSNEADSADKLKKIIEDSESINVKVLGPDINISRQTFTPIINPDWKPSDKGDLFEKSAGSIRFGLSAIKAVSLPAAMAITKERDENGAFVDMFDFLTRVGAKVVNKRVLESLIFAGAFDSFGIDRQHLFNSIDLIYNHVADLAKDSLSGQTTLFDDLDFGSEEKSAVGIDESGEKMSLANKLMKEMELLYYYVSGHPMSEFELFDEALNDIPDLNVLKRIKKAPFRLCGVVSESLKRFTKKDKRPWLSFNLSERSTSKVWDMALFGTSYEDYGVNLKDSMCVCVVGECRYDDVSGNMRFIINTLESMSSAVGKFVYEVDWLINNDITAQRFIKKLSQFIYLNKEMSGSSIQHNIKIKVSDDDYIKMSTNNIMTTSFNSDIFKTLRAEPAFVSLGIKVKPVPVFERKWSFRKSGG